MPGSSRLGQLTHLVTFVSLAVAALLALFAREWVATPAGAWALAIMGVVFVAALLILTSIASFADEIEGNTFSELLRQSTVETTFYPWALSAYMGRWFHPVDGMASPLGVWGPVVLMGATWGVVVLGDAMRREGRRIPPSAVVAGGFVLGCLAWPA